jgi:hypothetical protein
MTAILLISFAAMVFWLIGGIALRWGGVAAVAFGFAVALGMEDASGILLVVAGSLLWLAGHLHYWLRHGGFKSGLAGAVLGRGV